MQTKSTLTMKIDIRDLIKANNPLSKSLNYYGQVFGFASTFIVADALGLIMSNIDGEDVMIDKNNQCYRIITTNNVAPAFTKGYGRSKDGVDIKTYNMMRWDMVCVLDKPIDGFCELNVYKTTQLILNERGIIV